MMQRPLTPREGPAIGLFGGSFNPAHDGHRHVAEAGLRELQLDQVWWLVSPQNPLKPAQPDVEARAGTIDALDLPYAMKTSHMETRLGTRYTVDLIRQLRRRYPDTRWVYLIGSDNLVQMPRWKAWRDLFNLVPISVISRPGDPIKARLGRVARQFSAYRIDELHAHTLKDCQAPCWSYLTLPLNRQSSSAIRANRRTDR